MKSVTIILEPASFTVKIIIFIKFQNSKTYININRKHHLTSMTILPVTESHPFEKRPGLNHLLSDPEQ